MQQYFQPGIACSYPLLAHESDQIQIRYFFHPADQIGPDTLYLGSPRVCVIVDYQSLSVLKEIADPFTIEPFTPIEYKVSRSRRQQNQLYIEQLKGAYDTIVNLYPEQPSGGTGKQLITLLEAIVPNVLMPYYVAMSPDFIDWLRNH